MPCATPSQHHISAVLVCNFRDDTQYIHTTKVLNMHKIKNLPRIAAVGIKMNFQT
jgi:hypothetical protein